MRIGVDYTAAVRQGGGIGRYSRELMRAVVALASEVHFHFFAAAAGMRERWRSARDDLRGRAAQPERLHFRTLPLTDDWMARLWQRLRLPLPVEALIGEVDWLYSPDFVLPPTRRRTRTAVTVHDLSFLVMPETFPPPLRRYLEEAVPRSVARADLILADSEATRRDLIRLLGAAPDRIAVLYSGVSADFTPQAQPGEAARLRARYGLAERYILAVGTVQPRKNYRRLMQAVEPLGVQLVIVGKRAWLSEPIVAEAERRVHVLMPGFIEDGDLPALYRQAALLAFPSLYEGFGLPVLEAMACGTPVVASTASSVPEVVGEAGLLVEPTNVDGWTAAMRRLLDDTALRRRLREAGLRRAAAFTWEAAAQRWLRLLRGEEEACASA